MNSGVHASNEATGVSSLNSLTPFGTSGSMESPDETTFQKLSGFYMQQQEVFVIPLVCLSSPPFLTSSECYD